jgi:hypothetical protein
MPSADAIADRVRQAPSTPTAPSSDNIVGGLFSWLTKNAENAAGAEWSLGSKGFGDLTHFAEQDLIKPFETLGQDVYNAGDLAVDGIRGVLGFGKTVNGLAKSSKDTIDSLNNLLKNLGSGQGINYNLGGLGTSSALDLSGLQSLLSNLAGSGNNVTSPSGGTDYTSLLLIGGLVAGAGLVVYMVAKRKK